VYTVARVAPVGSRSRTTLLVALLVVAALVAASSGAASSATRTPRVLGFTCPFTAQKLTGLTQHLTGFRLVAFLNQNDGLHGTCIFVDPEPGVHSLLAGDRKFSLTLTKGLQTVKHENAAWRASPGWTVTNRPSVAKGAFEARLKARSSAGTNQLMLSFPAASGGSWGITIGTQTTVRLTQQLLDSVLVAIHAARSRW
jgi:hypothetical protein